MKCECKADDGNQKIEGIQSRKCVRSMAQRLALDLGHLGRSSFGHHECRGRFFFVFILEGREHM